VEHVKPGHIHPVVCLDAGHSEDYNRSPAVPEYYESDMNWTLHLLLKAALERYGIEVITTRETQETVLDVYERGAASSILQKIKQNLTKSMEPLQRNGSGFSQ